MAEEKKYTVQEVCDIMAKGYEGQSIDSMTAVGDSGIFADIVDIRHHPARSTITGIATRENMFAFESQVQILSEKYMQTKQAAFGPEDAIPGKGEWSVIGDNVILMLEYPSPILKGKREEIYVFPVVDGKVHLMEVWYDPPPPKVDPILHALEAAVRETVPYPDQTGIVFGDKLFELGEELIAIMSKIVADMEAGNTKGGGQGLVAALRKHAADEVSIRHHPPRKYADGKTTGKLWLDFEDAIIGRFTKDIKDFKPVEVWFKFICNYVVSHETRVFHQPDGQKKTHRTLRIWPVENGKITGYDAWYDPMPDDVGAAVEAVEAEVRKTIPLPKL